MEFAILAPTMILTPYIMAQICLTIWQWNTLQQVANLTARCAALGSTACASVTTGCTSSDAAVCYAETTAKAYGVSNVQDSDVEVDHNQSLNSVSFTTVTIKRSTTIVGQTFALCSSASFPNN